MTPTLIRSARLSDAGRIREIYAPSILESSTSFETTLPPLEEFESRIAEIERSFPWLVYEIDGVVRGYAYASSHRSRCAYGWSCESSVYVDKNFHGRGIGKLLYHHLFELLKVQGVVNVYTGITRPNPASVKLHESVGFSPIGTFKDVGYKLGLWWDVDWFQLQLQKPTRPAALKTPNNRFEIKLG